MTMRHHLQQLASAAMIAAAAGCATTGATWQSGVADRLLEHPPYAAGAAVPPSAVIARMPIAYQRGALQPEFFEPSSARGRPMATLITEMNAYFDSLLVGPRITPVSSGTPPDVRFGCETEPNGDCKERDNTVPLGREGTTMYLAVGRPSGAWIDATRAALEDARATHALVLTIEVGAYLPRQRGWRGDKSVELGTGYTVELPWLTSLETPVSVIQLTGALMGPDGKAVSIGAEGLLARRTSLVLSGFGAQELITDEDVERLRGARRDDLPGKPLVWRVAMRELVANLTGGRMR
jgi:hypothetical protein